MLVFENLDLLDLSNRAVQQLQQALMHLPADEVGLQEEVAGRLAGLVMGLGSGPHINKQQEEKESVTARLRVEESPGQGRYVVATTDIGAGELVVRDRPGVSALHASHRATNCQHCLTALAGTATPCPACSQVLFCSPVCRAAATFHGLECGWSDLLPGLGPLAPVCRIFTSRSAQFFLDRAALLDCCDPPATNLEPDTEPFLALFRLQAGCRPGSQYKVDKAALAYYTVCLLKRLEYFQDNRAVSLQEEHLVVGRFALHFLKVADDNCHEVCELELPATATFTELVAAAESVVHVVGVAIYPRISLFNNSCDVNTLKYHVGREEVLVARRDIRAGEEVTDFYGEYFFQSSRLARKRSLGFPCSCR